MDRNCVRNAYIQPGKLASRVGQRSGWNNYPCYLQSANRVSAGSRFQLKTIVESLVAASVRSLGAFVEVPVIGSVQLAKTNPPKTKMTRLETMLVSLVIGF